MALIAAHLNAGVILVVTVYCLVQSPSPPHLLGPRSPPVPLPRQLGVTSLANECVYRLTLYRGLYQVSHDLQR